MAKLLPGSTLNGIEIETVEGASQKVKDHSDNTTVHITAAERTKWNLVEESNRFVDNRNVNSTPLQYRAKGVREFNEFKVCSTIGLSESETGGQYITLKTTVSYSDKSGGPVTQVAYGANGKVYVRRSLVDDTGWQAWVLQIGKGDFDGHTTNSTVHITAAERTAWNAKASTAVATTTANGLLSKEDKVKLDGIASGAEVNQNTYSTIKVGTTSITSAAKTGTFEIVAGGNVTLTPDATNKKVTIAATNTTYSAMSQTDAETGTATTSQLITAAILKAAIVKHAPAPASATTGVKGIVQLSDATNSTSTALAATANAVKKAYDRAEAAFQSASDGKSKIVAALTGKGLTATASETFESLAGKINNLGSDSGGLKNVFGSIIRARAGTRKSVVYKTLTQNRIVGTSPLFVREVKLNETKTTSNKLYFDSIKYFSENIHEITLDSSDNITSVKQVSLPKSSLVTIAGSTSTSIITRELDSTWFEKNPYHALEIQKYLHPSNSTYAYSLNLIQYNDTFTSIISQRNLYTSSWMNKNIFGGSLDIIDDKIALETDVLIYVNMESYKYYIISNNTTYQLASSSLRASYLLNGKYYMYVRDSSNTGSGYMMFKCFIFDTSNYGLIHDYTSYMYFRSGNARQHLDVQMFEDSTGEKYLFLTEQFEIKPVGHISTMTSASFAASSTWISVKSIIDADADLTAAYSSMTFFNSAGFFRRYAHRSDVYAEVSSGNNPKMFLFKVVPKANSISITLQDKIDIKAAMGGAFTSNYMLFGDVLIALTNDYVNGKHKYTISKIEGTPDGVVGSVIKNSETGSYLHTKSI